MEKPKRIRKKQPAVVGKKAVENFILRNKGLYPKDEPLDPDYEQYKKDYFEKKNEERRNERRMKREEKELEHEQPVIPLEPVQLSLVKYKTEREIACAKRKNNFLIELERCRGEITLAAHNCGIPRKSIYEWMEVDNDFKELVELIDIKKMKVVEDKIFNLISKGNTKAIELFLKYRGWKYGYTEKQQIDITNKNLNFQINAIDIPQDKKEYENIEFTDITEEPDTDN